jgi:signal transduction histidine kinase
MSAAAYAGWMAAGLAGSAGVVLGRLALGRRAAILRACHEVRGPLTALGLAVELGCRGQGLSGGQLAAMRLELGRAALALDDLAAPPVRELAPQSSGTVDLTALVAESVLGWEAAARTAGVHLRPESRGGATWVTGDRLRLAQAVGNLIANAIEHGGGQVGVRVTQEGTTARVELRDHGPGLTEPLETLVARARRGRGRRGHGLAIASRIAAAHGGRLTAPPASLGARLVLSLPAAPPPA